MIEFAKKDSRRAIADRRQEFESRLAKIKQEEERVKQAQDRPRKRQVSSPRSVQQSRITGIEVTLL